MQEDDIALPFADAHGGVGQMRQLCGERGQLVVMRREEGARTVDLVQMFDRGPGDREAVIGRGAAADLVEDHQRMRARLIEDRRRLDHFDHEGRAAAGQIVGGADARKEPVDDADMGFFRRHEAAHLRHDRDQCVLPEKGRFAGHVGAGQQPKVLVVLLSRREIAVVGHELLAALRQRGLDDRVTAAPDVEGEARIDAGTRIAALDRQFGQGGGDVECGQRRCGRRNRSGLGHDGGGEFVEQLQFDFQRAAGRLGNAACEARQFRRGEAHRVGHGLAMNEASGEGRRGELFAVARRHLDVIAEHIVVADLQRRDAGFVGIFRLQAGDQAARVVAQAAGFVERRVMTLGDEAAIAGLQRQFRGQGGGEPCLERGGGAAQGIRRRSNLVRRRQQRGRRRIKGRGQRMGGGKPACHRGQIARAAAAEREARQRTRHVGCRFEAAARLVAEIAAFDEPFDRVETGGDGGGVGQRRGEAGGQFARAGARHRAVDHAEQRAFGFALQGLHQFEIGAGRRIDRHGVGGGDAARRQQRRQAADLGQFDIVEQRAHGALFGTAEGAEGVERGDAEMRLQPAFGGGAVEARRRQQGQHGAGAGDGRVGLHALGDQQFAGGEAGQLGGQGRRFERHGLEAAGRDVEPGQTQRCLGAGAGQRSQIIMSAGIEQRVLGQRTRGHQPCDGAGDDRSGAALLRLGRVLDLLADRDLEARADQPFEIGLVAVDRHAAHRDVGAGMLAALRQRDVEGGGGGDRVVEEELVEIAHAVEEQRAGVARLDRQILRHHGGRVRRGGRPRQRRRGGFRLGSMGGGFGHGGRD